jgi:NADH-quinone oxidoreductase subunit J
MLPGVVAIVLFVVLAYVFALARFGTQAGFPADANITANVGFAMFDLTGLATVPSEGFLVAFEIIDVVLVAALVAAVMLARRDPERLTTAIGTDGDDEGEE